MTQPNDLEDKISFATVLIFVLVCAAVSFAMSFAALDALAAAHGIQHSWLFPLGIDGGVIAFSACAYRAKRSGKNRLPYFAVILLLSAVSIALNIAHSTEGGSWNWVDVVIHGTPPFVLAIALEALMHQVSTVAQKADQERAKNARNAQRKKSASRKTKEGRTALAKKLNEEGKNIKEIAEEIQVDVRTVKGYLAAV